MKIKSISYNYENEWFYCELLLQSINLIVGKNATGKTRTLKTIVILLRFITQKLKKIIGKYKIEFENGNDIYTYELNTKMEDGKVHIKEEKLSVNGNIYINRNENGYGEIFSKPENKTYEFAIDNDIPAIYAKRDKKQHPVLEVIYDWCSTSMFCEFGTELGKTLGSREEQLDMLNDYYFIETNRVARNLKYALDKKEYGEELKKKLLDQMKELDYFIDDIVFEKFPDDIYSFKLMEHGIKKGVSQLNMSQGMFRAFSILTHSLINLFEHKVNLIVIDDIGEGLDYDRSTKLISILERNAIESNSQLIMYTNDRYVMNNMNLKYWQVIHKENNEIKFYSYKNHKDVFDFFELTGLSNFDFLSNKFYLNDVGK